MKNTLYVVLLFAMFYSAICCEKEASPEVENTGMPLIVKEIYNDSLYNEFTYNERNLLKERKSKWFYTVYHYDLNNRLTSADLYEDPGIYSSNWGTSQAAWNRKDWVTPENTQKSGIATYTYKNLIPESIRVLRFPGGIEHKSAFECDDKGRIVNLVFYSEGEISGKIAYSYDETGNVIREEHYYGDVLSGTSIYEYDNKHNPFVVFSPLLTPGIYTNANNIIKETRILANNTDPNTETVQVTESVYEYNAQGYPLTKNGFIRYEYK